MMFLRNKMVQGNINKNIQIDNSGYIKTIVPHIVNEGKSQKNNNFYV